MDYTQYEEVLTHHMLVFGIDFAVIACILVITLFVRTKDLWQRKKDSSESTEKRKLQFRDYACVLLLFVSVFLCAKHIWKCNYDIQNKAYIVWSGEFTVINSGRSCYIYLPNENGVQVEVFDMYEDGVYNGTVVYGEKTKVVVDCTVETIQK